MNPIVQNVAAGILFFGSIASGLFLAFGQGALLVAGFSAVISGLGGILAGVATAIAAVFTILVAAIGFVPVVIALAVAAIISLGVLLFTQFDKIVAAKDAIVGFFGFGAGDDLKVTGVADLTSKSTLDATLTVNARVQCVAETLREHAVSAIEETLAARRIGISRLAVKNLSPARPVPTYRFTDP